MEGFDDKKRYMCEKLFRAWREWKRCFKREWPEEKFPASLDEIVFSKKAGGAIKGEASLYLEGYSETFRDMCIEDLKKYPDVLKEKLNIDARIVKLKTRPIIGLADARGYLCCEMGHVVDVEFALRVSPKNKKGERAAGAQGLEK